MLMEELFSRGIMSMGPSRDDPQRQVGVFNPSFVAKLAALRSAEMEKLKWLAGEWKAENRVPATSKNPAYTDLSTAQFKFCEKDSWICLVAPDGREQRHITFDPLSKQWMYVLLEGAYGILRSPGWTGDQITFEGHMTMIGVDCELRQSWTKKSDDHFRFVNEEELSNGKWAYVDEWEFRRK